MKQAGVKRKYSKMFGRSFQFSFHIMFLRNTLTRTSKRSVYSRWDRADKLKNISFSFSHSIFALQISEDLFRRRLKNEELNKGERYGSVKSIGAQN